MEYGYIRVSSKEQNIDRQLDAFAKMILKKRIFLLTSNQEKISIDPHIKSF